MRSSRPVLVLFDGRMPTKRHPGIISLLHRCPKACTGTGKQNVIIGQDVRLVREQPHESTLWEGLSATGHLRGPENGIHFKKLLPSHLRALLAGRLTMMGRVRTARPADTRARKGLPCR